MVKRIQHASFRGLTFFLLLTATAPLAMARPLAPAPKAEAEATLPDVLVRGTVRVQFSSGQAAEAMAGVTILQKGTKHGTVSDANGIFSSPCPTMPYWYFL